MAFEESKHPRDNNGQFTDKNKSGSTSKDKVNDDKVNDDYEYSKEDIIQEIAENDYVYGDVESKDELIYVLSKRTGLDKDYLSQQLEDFDFEDYQKYINGEYEEEENEPINKDEVKKIAKEWVKSEYGNGLMREYKEKINRFADDVDNIFEGDNLSPKAIETLFRLAENYVQVQQFGMSIKDVMENTPYSDLAPELSGKEEKMEELIKKFAN